MVLYIVTITNQIIFRRRYITQYTLQAWIACTKDLQYILLLCQGGLATLRVRLYVLTCYCEALTLKRALNLTKTCKAYQPRSDPKGLNISTNCICIQLCEEP